MTRRSRISAAAIVLGVAAGLSGCLVSSFQPIYDGQSIVFDDRVLGSWENRELQISAAVTRAQWRSYAIEFTSRTGAARYTGFLTEIAGQRFLNVRPVDGVERPAYAIASNGILQIVVTPQELRARELDYDAVAARLKANTLKVTAVTDLQQNVVFTADTVLVRRWLATALQDESLFADWKTLVRK